MEEPMAPGIRIGEYLIEQLTACGIRHVFGIPGDYVLGLFDLLEKSPLRTIVCCDEQGAGFAADAYARTSGLGCVCITYGVGGLKVINSTAQAYAERSPVVVISGAPGLRERTNDPLLHHKVRGFDTQLNVFGQLTAASAALTDPETAPREISRVLDAAIRHKRPVYLELPRDVVQAVGSMAHPYMPKAEAADPGALEEALAEAAAMINAARRPVILASVEVHRLGLQGRVVDLATRTGIPIATTLLGKSVVRENMPLFIGVYEGAMGPEAARDFVEASDCIISLGVLNTDLDMGMFTARLRRENTISANIGRLAIRHHLYERVALGDFLEGLLAADLVMRTPGPIPHPPPPRPFVPRPGQPVTVERLFQRINAFLDDLTVVVADPGDALFGAADLVIHSDAEFIAPAYYSSLGFAVPGAVGVQLARPNLRPLVLVGDGAFQMTGQELSTAVRYGLSPIVLVLNNSGYGTERPMLDGPFNDVLPWHYTRMTDLLGAGKGFIVDTEDQLDAALEAARAYTDSFALLDVHLGKHDISPALKRLTATLGKQVR
jgi:indolepyruvate decarboxylase